MATEKAEMSWDDEHESEEGSLGNHVFGSSCNLAAGGAIYADVPEKEEGLTRVERTKENCGLIGMGAVVGAGMFAESYFLFAIGNLHTIWNDLYPSCDPKSSLTEPPCNDNLVSSLTYIEILGIMAGMLSFGFLADKLGRRWGSCSTATLMFIGAVFVTAAYAGPDNLNGMWIMFAVFLFIFSYGVGGEYPLASASAAERAAAEKKSGATKRHVRGKAVVFTFAMQGWGNFVNTSIILIFLAATQCTGDDKLCPSSALEITWRGQYGVGTLFIFCLMVGRFIFLKESKIWLENKRKQKELIEAKKTLDAAEQETNLRTRRTAFNKYGHRLFGTGVSWLVWDIVFYGNKLFQTPIIHAILGAEATVFQVLSYTLLNSFIALLGYYAAGFVIDKPWMGRIRLTTFGFFMTFLLFLLCGLLFDTLSTPENVWALQLLYYSSSFFGQFGPNCTLWLLPSEVFPTEVRTFMHGISATLGKLGALIATILFTYGGPGGTAMSTPSVFLVCAACGAIGLVITALFIPDVTTMNLTATDERFRYIISPELSEHDYHGEAVNPKYLSLYERLTGVGRNYVEPVKNADSTDQSVTGTGSATSVMGEKLANV